MSEGRVFLVGAGPGDPKLLTLRAAELIACAEVVAIDALVSKEIAAMISRSAEVVYVGKRASAHTLPQEQINQLLVDEAKKGKRVVRLKGGDPFVFGRGGEEAEELVAAGVPVEIVPGISSAIAGPAYAGIPVTHRSYATSVTLVTGHESDGSTGVDWQSLAKLNGTVVFMMGLGNLPAIARKLVEHGAPADRSVAVISKATTPQQHTVTGTLGDIVSRAEGVETPALIVVGDVIRMRESINWFETRPLFGKRIVVTRARGQASSLVRLLAEAGAQVVEFPTIEIAPPASYESLDRVFSERWDWIVFTSTNGVASFASRLPTDIRSLAGTKIAAVGEATADELRARGIRADLVPEKFQSIALLPRFAEDLGGVRIAVVRAEEGRDELLDGLRQRGAHVHLAVAYRTVAVAGDAADLQGIDAITFTSSSTVDNFFALSPAIGNALLASIGPVTSAALRKHGHRPDIEAESATVEALHEAVLKALTAETSGGRP